ncbi:hypothetical protein FQN60_004804, partial [Etheostoma spectabile]
VVVSCHFSANRHKWQSTPLPHITDRLADFWHISLIKSAATTTTTPVSELHGGIYCRCCAAQTEPAWTLFKTSSWKQLHHSVARRWWLVLVMVEAKELKQWLTEEERGPSRLRMTWTPQRRTSRPGS